MKENPEAGKPLKYGNLWELKVQMFRLFYIIKKQDREVRLLSIKHKDECDKYIKVGFTKDLKDFLDYVA